VDHVIIVMDTFSAVFEAQQSKEQDKL